MEKPIYLDYNATTPLDPEVFQFMKLYLESEFGNPSSFNHSYGWTSKMAVATARQQVAKVIGAHEKDIFWTSGATESNNLALLGTIRKLIEREKKPHVLTSRTEHRAVFDVCQLMTRWGVEVDFLDVNEYGQIDLKTLEKSIKPNTKLVSIMAANNEIGSFNPIKDIGQVTREQGIIFHTDAAQATGKIPIDVEAMNIDLLSISAHKLYGPKGVGAIYIRQNPKVELEPIMFGGGQEGGIRPGTLNVPGIVGLGKACEICHTNMNEEHQYLSELRDHLIESVLSTIPTARLNGHPTQRLANNVSFSFSDLSSDIFALGLRGLACSSGSACSSGDPQPSHVLKAIGHDNSLARATIRISIGRFTTRKDVQIAADKIIQMARRNKEISTSGK